MLLFNLTNFVKKLITANSKSEVVGSGWQFPAIPENLQERTARILLQVRDNDFPCLCMFPIFLTDLGECINHDCIYQCSRLCQA